MAVTANVNRDPKKRPKPFLPKDFMPRWERPRPQSWQDMKAALIGVTKRVGGTINDRRSSVGEPR